MAISKTLFGDKATGDGVDYTSQTPYVTSGPAPGGVIDSARIQALALVVAQEYKRRSGQTWSLNLKGFAQVGAKDIHNHLNTFKARIEVTPQTPKQKGHESYTRIPSPDNQKGNAGPDSGQLPETVNFPLPTTYTSGFQGVSAGGIIYAQNVNDLIDKLRSAGAACVCNCNYCTCNCNYCTCNCNYACTCNCNYG